MAITHAHARLSISGLGWGFSAALVVLFVLCMLAALFMPVRLAHGWVTLFSDAPIDSSRVWVDGLIWSIVVGWLLALVFGTILSRAARWNCSTADGRGSAPRKTWIAGQARPSGSPAPRSTSLHPRPGTRKLRDILRGDHWPLVSIEENSLNKSKEVRQSDEAGKAHNLELRDRADAHCVSLVISECGAVTRQTVRLCFQAGIRQRQKAKFAAYAV